MNELELAELPGGAGNYRRGIGETLLMQITAKLLPPCGLQNIPLYTLASLRPHGSLPTDRLDTVDLDFALRQRSLHADSLACKCFGFVLIV
jgi:hypothetical protein